MELDDWTGDLHFRRKEFAEQKRSYITVDYPSAHVPTDWNWIQVAYGCVLRAECGKTYDTQKEIVMRVPWPFT